jgi:hypothetical protein
MTRLNQAFRLILLLMLPLIIAISVYGFFSSCASADAFPAPYDCGFPVARARIVSPNETNTYYGGFVVDLIVWSLPTVLWTIVFRRRGSYPPRGLT